MEANFDEARALLARAAAIRDDLGTNLLVPLMSLHSSQVETLAGDFAAAERDLRRDYEMLSGVGERFFLPLVGALLAGALCSLGRTADAAAIANEAATTADEHDVETQALLRCVQAKVLARAGEREEAERLALEATALVREADAPLMQAASYLDLAEVLYETGSIEQGRAALDEAVALYELKRCRVAPPQVQTLLQALEADTTRAEPGVVSA